jgi:hypothetical protein
MTTHLQTMSQHFGAAAPDDDDMDIDIDIDMDADVEPIPEPELEVLFTCLFTTSRSYNSLTGRGRVRVDPIHYSHTKHSSASHLHRRS